MELVKEKINMNYFIGRAVTQLTLEDDFNVPDIKPDIEQVIEETGMIRITEAKPSEGKLLLKGRLEFALLYAGADSHQPLCKMTGSLPFEDSMSIDGLLPEHTVRVRWDMEDLGTRMINSRKVSVRSIVSISVTAHSLTAEEAALDQSVDQSVYTLGREMDLSQLHIQKKDIVRIKKEITVPASKPNVMEIVWERIMPGSMEIKVLDDKVSVRGDMNVFVMYTSAEEENPLQYFNSTVSFNEGVDSPGTREEMIGHIEARMIQWEMAVRENDDGEMRRLEVEFVLELGMTIYEEKHICLLKDVYANDRVITPVSKMMAFDNIRMQNQSVIKLNKIIPVATERSKILQICQTDAHIKTDRMSMAEQGILVEGVVYVQVLYIAADDKVPVNAVKGMIPFSHIVEVPGIHKKCSFEIIPSLGGVSSAMADSEEIEVRAELLLNTMVFERTEIPVIAALTEKPLDMEALDRMPGMTGYIVQAGDTMWDVAKKFSTTTAEIMDANQLDSDSLKKGQKLLIVREPVK